MIRKALTLSLAAGFFASAPAVFSQYKDRDVDDANRKLRKAMEEYEEQEIAVLRLRIDNRLRTVAFVLHSEDAPKTCENFATKCREGFYNGLAFHRAIRGFLVQTGDPLSREESSREEWGTGGSSHTIPAEKGGLHSEGAVAMARLKPEGPAHGSQFYISLAANSALDGQSTVFGKVVKGMDVLEDLSKVPVDANDNPRDSVRIESVRIFEPGSEIFETVDELNLKEERSRIRRKEAAAVPESEKTWLDGLLGKYW